jgi:iron-sulfur cluster repair protein YtfE (RIC family)
MKLTDALLGEHGALYAIFDQLDASLGSMIVPEQVRTAAQLLAAVLLSHAKLEDELLFPALEAQNGPIGPLAVMRHEHRQIDQAVIAAVEAENAADGIERLRIALQLSRSHFAKEEQILFRIAEQTLPAGRLEELAGRWLLARGITR